MATTNSSTVTIDPTYTVTTGSDVYTIKTDVNDSITLTNSATLTGMNNVFTNVPFEPDTITIGKTTLSEEKFQRLDALLDIIDGMEDSDLGAMLQTQILLNKVRNG